MKRMRNPLLTIALLLLLIGCGSSAQPASPLLADIGVTKQQLIVKNGNAFVWKEVTITIDGMYSYRVQEVPRGSSSYPLSEFISASGKPFEPGWLNLRQVSIHIADTGEGIPAEFHWPG
jgi:hypothetical protein